MATPKKISLQHKAQAPSAQKPAAKQQQPATNQKPAAGEKPAAKKKETVAQTISHLQSDVQAGYKDLVQKAKSAITKKLYAGATTILEDLLQKISDREQQSGAGTAKKSGAQNTGTDKAAGKSQSAQSGGSKPAMQKSAAPSSGKSAGAKPADQKSSAQGGAQKGAPAPAAKKSTEKTTGKSTSSQPESKKPAAKPAKAHSAVHGRDQHFIPGKGESNLVKSKDKPQVEKAFHQKEETALHMEQQRVKNNLATRQKRVFNKVG